MPVLFSIHVTPHPKGLGKPCVRAVAALAPVGVFDVVTRDFLQPDKAAVREALPHQWRKAFDRSGGNFWYDSETTIAADDGFKPRAPYLNLRNAKGHSLATIYALPYRFEPQGPNRARAEFIALYVQDVREHPTAYKADVVRDAVASATRLIEGLDDDDVERLTNDLRDERALIEARR